MSNYPAFEVYIDNEDGTVTPVPNEVVHVYDVTHGVALADTASDASGTVPAAAVAVAAGTRLRFSVRREDGLCGYDEKVTS